MHDALRHTVPVYMCALYMRLGHVEQMSEISQSSRTTMVELSMKVSIIFTCFATKQEINHDTIGQEVVKG